MKKATKILGSVRNADCPVRLTAVKAEGEGSLSINTVEDMKLITISLFASVMEEGTVTIPSRYLRILDDMEGQITIEKAKDCLAIKGASSYSVPFYSGEIAQMRESLPVGSVTFELREIKDLFRKVIFATGDDDEYGFDCILLECASDCIKAVCTDRRIIAISRLKKGSPYKGSFLLHKSGVNVLSKIDGDMITMTFFEDIESRSKRKAVQFSVSGEIMVDILMPEFSLIFPRCEEVLDLKTNTTLSGAKGDFLRAIGDNRKLSREVTVSLWHTGYVKNKPRLSSREDNGASTVETYVDLDWRGDDIKTKLNAKTFESAIAHCDGRAIVRFSSDKGPLFIGGEDDSYLCVMMPYTAAEKR